MTSASSILTPLNPAQREAVTTTEGPLLVIAGAGSGKTRVITHRIAYLVRECGVHPWEIFAATFTNKAAAEMRHRIGALLPGLETARLTVATFHSICVSILRREAPHAGLTSRFTIADDTDQMALIKDCLRDLEIPASRIKPDEIRNWISRAKIHMAKADEARSALEAPAQVRAQMNADPRIGELRQALNNDRVQDFVRVYAAYEARLALSNAVDFDDLLLKVVRLYQEQPDILRMYQDRWQFFLVDEYQDTNGVQCELMRLLASRERNICVVGDEDQSIYSWRGAEIENILNFDKEYEGTRIVRLEQNYRSTETILQAADAVIAHNKQRHAKTLWSERGMGEPIAIIEGMDEREEAAKVVDTVKKLHRQLDVPYRDIAIFYRVNALSRLFEDFLREAKIQYRVVGGVRFYDRMEIKDLLAYLRLIANPLDGLSLTRIINKPRRGIGEKTLTKLFSDAARNGTPIWMHLQAAVESDELSRKAKAGIAGLLALMERWREMSVNHSPAELLDAILKDTGYEEDLGDPRAMETLSRLENIAELRRALEEYTENNPDSALDDYLEMVSLTQAIDAVNDEDDCVSLMTLHSAKGLEFPCVFITGLEEGIFPNGRVISETGNVEEERRLFYVGVTRAKERLFLSRADSRSLYGRHQYNPPSVFLIEVPRDLTQSLASAIRSWGTAEPKSISRSPLRDSGSRALALAEGSTLIETETPLKFPPGSRIRHRQLGEGEVLSVRGTGEKRKVSIRFDAGLELEVLEQYGGLERMEDLPF